MYMSPLHVFFEASHWPSGHMIRSRPLIGPPFPHVVLMGFFLLRKIMQPLSLKKRKEIKSRDLSKIVSVLLSALVNRFFVSHMRNFFSHNLSYVTIWVFEFCHNFSFWVVTILVFEFHHNVSVWISSQFEVFSFITIWVFEIDHNLGFKFCHKGNNVLLDSKA